MVKSIKVKDEYKEIYLNEGVSVIGSFLVRVVSIVVFLIPIINIYLMYKHTDNLMVVISNKIIEKND